MQKRQQQTIYRLVFESVQQAREKIQECVNAGKLNDKERKKILRVARRSIRTLRNLCLQLSGVPHNGFVRFAHSQVTLQRMERLKAEGVPLWKRCGAPSEEEFKARRREASRQYYARKKAKR